MRVTKKMRADAITICELDGGSARDCADSIGAEDSAINLAVLAVRVVCDLGVDWSDDLIDFIDWREAGGILRDGWSPGDPVVRRGGRS